MSTIIKNLKVISNQPRLIPERKKLLVAALRSGDYKQVQGTLGLLYPDNTKKHCCLGVGCEVSPFEAEWDTADLETQPSATIRWEGDTGTWQRQIAEWFGSFTIINDKEVVEDNPLFFEFPDRELVERYESRMQGMIPHPAHWTAATATYCNDKANLTFDQIADLFDFWL